PKSLIQDTLAMVTVPVNVRVENKTDDEPLLKLDIDKIKRAFINIVNNAIDAMPEGGTLTISAKDTDGMVDFMFADSGVGMTKEVMQRIFAPLFTTKAKGMGFGLSICKRIIEAHNGRISVDS